MGKKRQRCIFCARVLENEYSTEIGLELFVEPPKSQSICPLCRVKLRKEAEDSRQKPRPM